MLRVVFLGTELQILDALRTSPVHLLGVYLPPIRRSRWKPREWLLSLRVMREALSPLARMNWAFFRKWRRTIEAYALTDYLARNRIRALRAPHINAPEFLKTLADLQPDLGIVANFGQILRESLLQIPRLGFINFHPTLLPRYRGPTPFGHILLNGEKRSGATWHFMTPQIDRGDILAQEEVDIAPRDTTQDLAIKSVRCGVKMLRPLLQQLEDGSFCARAQDELEATTYPKLSRDQKERLKELGRF